MVRSHIQLALILVTALVGCKRELNMCEPGTVAARPETTVLFADQTDALIVEVDSSHLYWTAKLPGGDREALLKGPKDGSSPPVRLAEGEFSIFTLDTHEVYVLEKERRVVLRVAKSGGKATEFFRPDTMFSIDEIHVDSTAVFFRGSDGKVLRVPKAGGDAKWLDTGNYAKVRGLLTDDESLYFWTDGDPGTPWDFRVFRMPKMGGPITDVLRGPALDVSEVQLVNGWLYWSTRYAIMREPVGGGARSWLVSTSGETFFVHPAHVYFREEGILYRVPLAGGTAERVAKLPCDWLTSDGQSFYFTTYETDGNVGKLSL
jgi:hypothetical protein